MKKRHMYISVGGLVFVICAILLGLSLVWSTVM